MYRTLGARHEKICSFKYAALFLKPRGIMLNIKIIGGDIRFYWFQTMSGIFRVFFNLQAYLFGDFLLNTKVFKPFIESCLIRQDINRLLLCDVQLENSIRARNGAPLRGLYSLPKTHPSLTRVKGRGGSCSSLIGKVRQK